MYTWTRFELAEEGKHDDHWTSTIDYVKWVLHVVSCDKEFCGTGLSEQFQHIDATHALLSKLIQVQISNLFKPEFVPLLLQQLGLEHCPLE